MVLGKTRPVKGLVGDTWMLASFLISIGSKGVLVRIQRSWSRGSQ
jgi:hypothetical protein